MMGTPMSDQYQAPLIFILTIIFLSIAVSTHAERIYFAGYNGGFYIKSEQNGGMALRLGGAFQTEYRGYGESQRADNGFDIRRARLKFRGELTRYFRFGLQYEFQGNETNNLVDAFGEAVFGLHSLRFGQFKEPFSLQWQTRDKGHFFAERSMGYYLGSTRDIGLMLHGSFVQDTIQYGVGIFNGDGDDGSSSGQEQDSPEAVCRLAISPFQTLSTKSIKSFQIGGSAAYAEIDPLNVDLSVKTSGMAATDRNIYVLGHNTKFGVLQKTGQRERLNVEAAWSYRFIALQGEYFFLKYKDLEATGSPPADADFSSWYFSALWCLTGEELILSKGVMKPLYPNRFFNPEDGSWGSVCIGARVDHFSGDEEWINSASHVSVKEADAVSIAVNWVLFPMQRFVVDYTHTDFSDPIRVRVLPNGTVDYITKENVVTIRFSMDF
jgi:phosphate-selective porin OprO/OprP